MNYRVIDRRPKFFDDDQLRPKNTEEKEPKPSIKEVITTGTSPDKLGDILKKYYDQLTEQEKIILLDEICETSAPDMPTLQKLSHASNEVARVAESLLFVLSSSVTSFPEISRMYRQNRYREAFDADLQTAEEMFFYLKKKNRPEVAQFNNPTEFIQWYSRAGEESDVSPAQFTDDLNGETIALSATFGIHTPTYLDLLGPNGILKLKAMHKPKLLLLGSMGKWSGKEFNVYAKRLNSNSVTSVIDFDKESVHKFHKENQGTLGSAVAGNILEMPYKDNSWNQVYTNSLLHHLREPSDQDFRTAGRYQFVDRFFQEVSRVLVTDGHLIMSEINYTEMGSRRFILELARIADYHGLRLVAALFKSPTLLCRADIWQANKNTGITIDDLGFPTFNDLPVCVTSGHPGMKFVKG